MMLNTSMVFCETTLRSGFDEVLKHLTGLLQDHKNKTSDGLSSSSRFLLCFRHLNKVCTDGTVVVNLMLQKCPRPKGRQTGQVYLMIILFKLEHTLTVLYKLPSVMCKQSMAHTTQQSYITVYLN